METLNIMKTTNQIVQELTRLLQEKGVFPVMINKDSVHGVMLTIKAGGKSWDLKPAFGRATWDTGVYLLTADEGPSASHSSLAVVVLDIWSRLRNQKFHDFQRSLGDTTNLAVELGVPLETAYNLFLESLQCAVDALTAAR